MKIFKDCKYLVQTIPEQVYDDGSEKDKEDLDTLADDHGVDALRYFGATYRAIEETIKEKPMTHQIYDIGGAKLSVNLKTKAREYAFKKEEESMAFSWAAE